MPSPFNYVKSSSEVDFFTTLFPRRFTFPTSGASRSGSAMCTRRCARTGGWCPTVWTYSTNPRTDPYRSGRMRKQPKSLTFCYRKKTFNIRRDCKSCYEWIKKRYSTTVRQEEITFVLVFFLRNCLESKIEWKVTSLPPASEVVGRLCLWLCSQGGSWQERRPLQRAVSILLECILVW